MKRIEIVWKWIKVCVLVPLAIFLSVMLFAAAEYAWDEAGSFGGAAVDPRTLEALELYYICLHMVMLLGLFLFLTIVGLLRTLYPKKQPGSITKHLRQYGLNIALIFAVLFVVCLVFSRFILHQVSVLEQTIELYPVSEIILYNQVLMLASLFLVAAVVSFASGIKGILIWNQKHKEKEDVKENVAKYLKENVAE